MSSESQQIVNKQGTDNTIEQLDDSKELIELFNKLDEEQRKWVG